MNVPIVFGAEVADNARCCPSNFTSGYPRSTYWGNVSAETEMPDLYALFAVEGGGTINVRLNKVAVAGEDAAREGDSNSRLVVINEVMWAYDNALVGQATRTKEQWIEIHNRATTPRLITQLQLTTSKAFPAPAAETDRMSNNPAYNNTWNITGKGQHGNGGGTVTEATGVSQFEKVDFVSMIRVNHDNGWEEQTLGFCRGLLPAEL